MAEEVAREIAETLQTAHINPQPDPAFDSNPSTTASQKAPVKIQSHSSIPSFLTSDEIPIELLEPVPRTTALPPLPDLRFEQSYLARIGPYADAGNYKMVVFYTIYDNVFMPLTQGVVWRLALFGWRHFNTGTKFSGRSYGARLRRWWWGVNNWKLPPGRDAGRDKVGEFVVNQFGSAGQD